MRRNLATRVAVTHKPTMRALARYVRKTMQILESCHFLKRGLDEDYEYCN